MEIFTPVLAVKDTKTSKTRSGLVGPCSVPFYGKLSLLLFICTVNEYSFVNFRMRVADFLLNVNSLITATELCSFCKPHSTKC